MVGKRNKLLMRYCCIHNLDYFGDCPQCKASANPNSAPCSSSKMSNSSKDFSDLGDKAIHHSEYNSTCSLNAPGDYMEEDLEDVDCPECIAHFESLRRRRARARG